MKIRSLLIGMLASIALVGCTNNDEELSTVIADDQANVNVALSLEGAVASRVVSDGTGANTLMYAVFEKVNENEVKQIRSKITENNVTGLVGSGHNVSISLLKGKTYQLVFWAQNDACKAYTVSDDMKLSVDYTKLTNNQESSDAFFAVKELTVSTNTSVDVILKRPFAQVNVGAFKVDLDEAIKDLGKDINQSKATIKGVAKGLDLLTGKVTDEKIDVTFNFGDILTSESLVVDQFQNGSVQIYQWISMTYVLASSEFTSHDMVFEFTNKDDKSNVITVERVGEDSPQIRRNYRTNIVGQVLFGLLDCKVVIDPKFDDVNRSGYVFYVFNESTSICNQDFALQRYDDNKETWCVFTAPQGNTDDNLKIKFYNVNFYGHMYGVMFGHYWLDPNTGYSIPTTYNFEINKVNAQGVIVDNCIHDATSDGVNHNSLLFYLRGNTTVTNCTWTGTVKSNEYIECKTCIKEGVEDCMHNSIAYDCGVPDNCKSNLTNCRIGSMYVWQKANVNLQDCYVGYIRAKTYGRSASNRGVLKIGAGTTVEVLEITTHSYNNLYPAIEILPGATVGKIILNGRPQNKTIVISEGAVVKEIID